MNHLGHDPDRCGLDPDDENRPAEGRRWATRVEFTFLELGAALSLSRLASSPDAHQLLGEVVGRFTEGHDTADLRAAQTQLSLIHPPTGD